jgi:hypothetical protein
LNSLLPDLATRRIAVEIYLQHSHYQPLCVFDAGDANQDAYWSEDAILPVLALVSLRDVEQFKIKGLGIQSHEVFGDAARRVLMSRLASGTVTLKTLQALCLVAFYNHISKHRRWTSELNLTLPSQGRTSGISTPEHSSKLTRIFRTLDLSQH